MLLQHDVNLLDCCLQVCRGVRLALQAVRCRRPTLWRSPTPRSLLQVCRRHPAEHTVQWMLCSSWCLVHCTARGATMSAPFWSCATLHQL